MHGRYPSYILHSVILAKYETQCRDAIQLRGVAKIRMAVNDTRLFCLLLSSMATKLYTKRSSNTQALFHAHRALHPDVLGVRLYERF